MAKKKKKRLKLNRVIFAIILVIALIMGVYNGARITIQWLSSIFFGNDFIEEVTGPVIGTVVLDAGHGGSDVGCSNGDIYEKDINLRYAKEIGNYLMQHGVNVIYTRKDDVRLGNEQNADLRARCDVSKQKNIDYFISIHVNSHETKTDVSGFEIYYLNNNEHSYTLATNVSNAMEEIDYSKNRGVLEGKSLYVIRNNSVPPILIELGYIKGNDIDYLLSDSKTEKLSKSIAEGIIKTIKEKE